MFDYFGDGNFLGDHNLSVLLCFQASRSKRRQRDISGNLLRVWRRIRTLIREFSLTLFLSKKLSYPLSNVAMLRKSGNIISL